MRPFQPMIRAASFALATVALASCQQNMLAPLPTLTPALPSYPPAPAPPASATATATARPAPHIFGIDDYKILVAEQILGANPSITFSGRLPPMLPAVVVVNISIDKDGGLANVVVQRSRNHEASEVALASVKRSAPFPKPKRMITRGLKTLDFSETFLFNHQYQFQLRTLAGPQ